MLRLASAARTHPVPGPPVSRSAFIPPVGSGTPRGAPGQLEFLRVIQPGPVLPWKARKAAARVVPRARQIGTSRCTRQEPAKRGQICIPSSECAICAFASETATRARMPTLSAERRRNAHTRWKRRRTRPNTLSARELALLAVRTLTRPDSHSECELALLGARAHSERITAFWGPSAPRFAI